MTYLGFCRGAQTTAKLSGSIHWNPECVWRSTEDIKPWDENVSSEFSTRLGHYEEDSQVCVGWVCIHPSVISPLSSVNDNTPSSSSIAHVSLVACCFGINSTVTTYASPLARECLPLAIMSLLCFPSNSPHVSLFTSVFALAMVLNRCRHALGTYTVLSTRPDSSRVGCRLRSSSE